MIDFFDNFAFWGDARKSKFLNRLRLYSSVRLLVVVITNVLLPIYFKLTAKRSENKIVSSRSNIGVRYIVSLTTFPLRIGKVYLVIESMLRQKCKPDKIILYLSKEQFSGLSDLPKNLLSLQDRGLQIELVDGDMRSHKKYLYAMRQFPKDNIITIDDDVIYRSDFIQSFVEMSKKFPHCIIGNRCKVTSSSKDYCYNHMRDAKNEDALVPREDLLSIGASGVLYPPDALFEDFDNEILIKKCVSLQMIFGCISWQK